MGAVYQAKDVKRQGTLCAIKEMSVSRVAPEDQAQAIRNFKIEAKMLHVLSHPYLPAFTHFFAENQRYFLVMEYIDGATLEDLLERNGGPFSERRVLSWAEQLCDVLEYLHSQHPPIIFRDMKPGNIMLTRQGHIKLIDFGIARFFRPSHTTDTQLLGTPGYSPQEQYGTTQTDERSDIYALGMTLHHLLTNHFAEIGFGVTARDIRARNPQVSLQVARALEKATALMPADRYQNVAAFRRALFQSASFTFESGETATDIDQLATLCESYPEETFEYLESGELVNWLRDIGEESLADFAWQLCADQLDPRQAVEEFLQALPDPVEQLDHYDAPPNGYSASQWEYEDEDASLRVPIDYHSPAGYHQTYTPGRLGLSTRAQTQTPRYGTMIEVTPKMLDFGPVYPPGISAPLRITISGVQGGRVRGSVQVSEPWIRLDATEFDGTCAYVNVQIRSSQLQSYQSYHGEITILPEGGSPATVAVEAEI